MKEREIPLFNDLILSTYYSKSLLDYGQNLLKNIHGLVPYNQGYFLIINEDGEIDTKNSIFSGMDDKTKDDYINNYFKIDYINHFYQYTNDFLFKDSDLFNSKYRKSSDFYKKYLKPQELENGCGLIITHENKVIAIVNLLRTIKSPDISSNEIDTLKYLKGHIKKNILHFLESKINNIIDTELISLLTDREIEVLNCILKNYTNKEIADELFISISTVKKHIYSIYKKLNVRNRNSLLEILRLN